jgi:predicted RNase H-like HicB family nuclease
MTQQAIYVVTATRTDDWWALEVPEVPGATSRARRLDQAEGAAREAIAVLLDVPADGFGVEVEPELEGPSGELLHVARLARERAELAQEEARTKTIAAVRTFAGQGMTVRDIGRLIGVSHQQAAKLLRREEHPGSLTPARSESR